MIDATRQASLKAALNERRYALDADVRGRIREGRSERPSESGDAADHSDAHVQNDLQLALLHMRLETLARIDEAIVRLDAGEYGSCIECEGAISEPRLRAMPFAVRCRPCAAGHEQAQARTPRLAHEFGGPLLPHTSGR